MSENLGSTSQRVGDDLAKNVTGTYGAAGGQELERAGSNTASGIVSGAGQFAQGAANAPAHLAQDAVSGRLPAILRPAGKPNFSPKGVTKGLVEIIYFDFNPDRISIMRRPRKETRATHSTVNPYGSYKWALDFPPGTITISNVIFEGLGTKSNCDTLLDWCSPQGGMSGKMATLKSSIGKGISRDLWDKQQHLMFIWGPPMTGFFYEVTLDSVNVVYERFTRVGVPVRASVSLTMTEEYNPWTSLPTNPTSGGLPGRREHVVTQGDNLQLIALNYFGTPGAWRPIAHLNGIDDPFRLRPGQRVLIPNPSELPPGGER